MKIKFTYILILILSIFISTAYSQTEKNNTDSPIILNAVCDNQSVFIGDEINFKVEIKRNKNVEVEEFTAPLKLGDFEVRNFSQTKDQELKDGKFLRELKYVLAVYATGEYEIPSITVKCKVEGENIELKSSPIQIKVKPVPNLSTDKDNVREVKPVVVPPVDYTKWKWATAISAIVIILLIIIIYLYRKFKKKAELGEIGLVPSRPIDEITLEELDRIAKSDLLDNNMIKQYYTQVSDAIRNYLSVKFKFDAIDRTSSEIMQILSEKNLEASTYKLIDNFHTESDLVKFAKLIPERKQCEDIIIIAKEIVHITYQIQEETKVDAEAVPNIEEPKKEEETK